MILTNTINHNDKVWSISKGDGVVVSKKEGKVHIRYDNGELQWVEQNGLEHDNSSFPVVFRYDRDIKDFINILYSSIDDIYVPKKYELIQVKDDNNQSFIYKRFSHFAMHGGQYCYWVYKDEFDGGTDWYKMGKKIDVFLTESKIE